MKITNTSQRLQQIMKEKNLKQIDILNRVKPLCEKYGIKLGSNDLSQYVQGKVEPSQRKLSVLAEALNTNEVWLMGYDVPLENKDDIVINISDYTILVKDIYPYKEGEKIILKDLFSLLNYYNSFMDEIKSTFDDYPENEIRLIIPEQVNTFLKLLDDIKKQTSSLINLSDAEKNNLLTDIKKYNVTIEQLEKMLNQNDLPNEIKEKIENLYSQTKNDKREKETLIQKTERKIIIHFN